MSAYENDYAARDILRLARRIHNPKRAYLLVNPLQGKHIPVSPRDSLEMMSILGNELAAEFPAANLVIGFAETATAIGAMAASCFGDGCVYVHTTREPLPPGASVEFREEHSHAVEQTLFCADMEDWLARTATVIFIDDELSTGRTLINMIAQLSRRFPALGEKRLVAASILNRLTPENEQRLNAAGIVSRCLVKLPQTDYTQAVAGFTVTDPVPPPEIPPVNWEHIPVTLCNSRLGVLAFDYLDVCRRKAEDLLAHFRSVLPANGSVLVLGAEECMFPALVLGAVLEHQGGFRVRCHATTRSPIGVSRQDGYPIREGWRLRSLYDSARTTYLYNLDHYDAAILVSGKAEPAGLQDLAAALNVHGCGKFYLTGGQS